MDPKKEARKRYELTEKGRERKRRYREKKKREAEEVRLAGMQMVPYSAPSEALVPYLPPVTDVEESGQPKVHLLGWYGSEEEEMDVQTQEPSPVILFPSSPVVIVPSTPPPRYPTFTQLPWVQYEEIAPTPEYFESAQTQSPIQFDTTAPVATSPAGGPVLFDASTSPGCAEDEVSKGKVKWVIDCVEMEKREHPYKLRMRKNY